MRGCRGKKTERGAWTLEKQKKNRGMDFEETKKNRGRSGLWRDKNWGGGLDFRKGKKLRGGVKFGDIKKVGRGGRDWTLERQKKLGFKETKNGVGD